MRTNKSQLIDALAARFEGNRRAAAHALESVLDTITREVAKGNKVAITGFGSFEKRVRNARMVRNPRTGEQIRAKRTTVPKFTPWRNDPTFVLNDPVYAAGSVLVAGPDFGTGSSREHAVWALQDHGFKVVISPRFGDIFRGNAGKAGLLAAQVDEKVVQRLWDYLEQKPGATVTVDLESRTVRAGEGPDAIVDSFDIDDYTRWRLLEGLDDIGITLGYEADIATYELTRRAWKPATL